MLHNGNGVREGFDESSANALWQPDVYDCEVFVLGSVSNMGLYLNQLHHPNVRISSSPGEHDPLRSMLHGIL